MVTQLGVGVIGVGSEKGWAREAHVPGAQAVEGLDVVAVATRDQDTADEAATALGVRRGYGDAADLIADPDVAIVTVAAPVPAHHDLILAALEAGKHVMTEWPVGTGTQQTDQLAEAARASGLKTAVDLQARRNPAAVRARDLIQQGSLGRLLRVSVLSTAAGFGPHIPARARYLEDPATGMNLSTIQTAHTLDLVLQLAGPLESLAALTTVQYPTVEVDDGTTLQRTVPDHVLVQGRLAGGAALSVQVVGGLPPERTPFWLELVGEAGSLRLEGGTVRGFQAGLLSLAVDGRPVEVERGATGDLPDAVVNVSGVYAALRDDITTGSSSAPSFSDAAQLSHLIDDMQTSGAEGWTVDATAAWPGIQ